MKVQDFFTAGKLIALVSIIAMGVYGMIISDTNNFDNAWEGVYEPKNICYAFMQGLFAFGKTQFIYVINFSNQF